MYFSYYLTSVEASLFGASCSSSFRKRRIRSNLYGNASSYTRLRLRKRPLVAVNTGIILRESHSLIGIFSNLDKKKWIMGLSFTLGPRCPGFLPNIQVPWRYRPWWRSQSVPRPVVLYLPGLLTWRCRPGREWPCFILAGDLGGPV